MQVTVEEIRNIIEESGAMVDMDTLQNDTTLTEQDVDSLDTANIYLSFEETFKIKIPDGDLDQLKSIDEIVTYLNNK